MLVYYYMEILQFIYNEWPISLMFLFAFYEIINVICKCITKSFSIKYGNNKQYNIQSNLETSNSEAPTEKPNINPKGTGVNIKTIKLEK